jgi:nitronate monooxygenase
MWYDTPGSKCLGIRYPIIQGPFGGGGSSVELVSIVSNAGGLGSFGVESMEPAQIIETAKSIRRLTDRPFAMNLWIPLVNSPTFGDAQLERNLGRLDKFYRGLAIPRPATPLHYRQDHRAQVEALLEANPPVFSFVYGIPSADILGECKRRNITTLGTATTPAEAAALETAGVDCVVASGFEAGGHRGSFLKPAEASLMGTMALIPQVVDRVRIPVIAAGGIADARGVKAALCLGAAGVQIGTAFLACNESSASEAHRNALFGEAGKQTVLTKMFTGRLARSIRNHFTDEMHPDEDDVLPYPAQGWLTNPIKVAATAQGKTELIPMSAGQSAPLLTRRDAKSLFASLVEGLSADATLVPVHRSTQ